MENIQQFIDLFLYFNGLPNIDEYLETEGDFKTIGASSSNFMGAATDKEIEDLELLELAAPSLLFRDYLFNPQALTALRRHGIAVSKVPDEYAPFTHRIVGEKFSILVAPE